MNNENHKPIIYLDLHGVICDFVGPAHQAHGKSYDESKLLKWGYLQNIWAIDEEDFWRPISNQTFWSTLPIFPWAVRLYQELCKHAEVVVCTAPAGCDGSLHGTVELVEKTLGLSFNHIIFARAKYLLARPNAILIDDSPEQIDQFRHHGGIGITFPALWNEARDISEEEVVQTVIAQVKAAIEDLGSDRERILPRSTNYDAVCP